MTVAPALAQLLTGFGFNGGRSTADLHRDHRILDRRYRPVFPVDARYEDYFRPTMVTDADGCLAESLIPDLGGRLTWRGKASSPARGLPRLLGRRRMRSVESSLSLSLS